MREPLKAFPPGSRSDNHTNRVREVATSFRHVADGVIKGVKEWAGRSLTQEAQEACSISNDHWADAVCEIYSPKTLDADSSRCSDQAIETLYGAKSKLRLLGDLGSNGQESSQTKRTVLQSIVSPFLLCAGAGRHLKRSPPCGTPASNDGRKSQSPCHSSCLDPVMLAFEGTPSFDDGSLCTTDSQPEVRNQVCRMAYQTEKTNGTHDSRGTAVTLDDDGRVIPRKLLQQRQLRRQRRNTRRTKVVKFDYPPISSVREYPRADPADLAKLFFTEEELDQIEDDRYNTLTADDVEIVASPCSDDWDERIYLKSRKSVSTGTSGNADALVVTSSRDNDTSKLANTMKVRHGSHLLGKEGNGDTRMPAPAPSDETIDEHDEISALESQSFESTEEVPRTKSKNMNVRKVQIYLRERSTAL